MYAVAINEDEVLLMGQDDLVDWLESVGAIVFIFGKGLGAAKLQKLLCVGKIDGPNFEWLLADFKLGRPNLGGTNNSFYEAIEELQKCG